MYKHFFGLRENPFNVNPDPRYLFLTPQTREALDELTYGIQARKGLILLTGEVGTGKTTMINRLLDWLRQQQTPTAFIFNSHLEISHLFDFILADFGVPFDARLEGNALMRLNQWLFERYRAGETPVIIVDEAQGLPDHVLEEIRMLLNLETPSEKLLQIVLVGQPELEARLKRPELRQIKQRITLRCNTAALTLKETHDYIQARLHIAGANGKPVFASQAMDAVHFYSRGIPRVINLLCEHALINAYVEHIQPVPAPIVAEVAREFQFDDITPVAPFKDSRDTMDSDLTDTQSRFKSGPVSPPAAIDSPRKEQPGDLTTSSLAPFAGADTVLSPLKESAKSVLVLEPEQIPDVKEDAEAPKPLGVEVSAPAAPWPRRIVTRRPSELTQFVSEVVTQFSAGSEMKPMLRVVEARGRCEFLPGPHLWQVSSPQKPSQPTNEVEATKSGTLRSSPIKNIGLRVFPIRWSTRLNDGSSSPGASPTGTRRTAIVRQCLKRSLQPLRAWRRFWLAWKDGCLATVVLIDWPRGKASVYRWLRQPSNPTQWRLPDWRLFEGRRSFNYKKL